ncbi:3-deoxy-7-phosphoheptulonate synthase [Streptomyces sp. CB03238]|uniref:3-deoxy-7-phosphoheptulonate synthase n=1 Tax=Streptomyces sp. CB03238 TaxID=1907777 RepID=UPI000A1031AD|nr:3-deoxy-7-phosphoheptulonate synthase [Streptomyces sp. CB03238]ORT56530.1 phospho-2-dehydro-3-deoxyheptonate aldolase [Streptomyces sp. CB03238]
MTVDTGFLRERAPQGSPIPDELAYRCRALTAGQQPEWPDQQALDTAVGRLAQAPGLVTAEEVRQLRLVLAEVAGGAYHVIQSGDCAEDPAECTPAHLSRKAALLDALAGVMKLGTGKPVVRVGRVAGQFAKPRSSPVEQVDGQELQVFRGHLVNSPGPAPHLRVPDPARLLTGYHAAKDATAYLRGVGGRQPRVDAPLWTSHEALLLDYELPLVRRESSGRLLLTSTHWPWIGERTRQLDGAHVELLASVVNPVACKVGPSMTPDELLRLCERLDPDRTPGRLTLISRMGHQALPQKLPVLVDAVRSAGHPVIWLCDPMHGNTVKAPNGFKTRLVDSVVREVRAFRAAVSSMGGVAAGIHLETTPDAVHECVRAEAELDGLGSAYTSLCDPRLNPQQALDVVAAWR